MAGERLAKQVVQVVNPEDGKWVQLYLGGLYHLFEPSYNGTGINMFRIIPPQTNYQRQNALSFVAAVRARILAFSLPYTVTEQEIQLPYCTLVTIEATTYDRALDFQPVQNFPQNGLPGILQWDQADTIRPVFVDQQVTDAGIFGSATGAVTLTARNGNDGVYTYTWADGPTTASRPDLLAGRYTCVVADTSGASTSVTVLVREDAQLSVVVNRVENDVTLEVGGGLAPYAFVWEDGSTLPTRLDLEPGTYTCTITDARGATTDTAVTISAFQFYFSLNPILLPLDAGDAYRADPTTKPNLSFCCEVYIEPEYLSDEFVRLGDVLEQPADRYGRTTFEVQALLDTYLQEHLPSPGQQAISRADSLFKRFYLLSYERFGEPLEEGPQLLQSTNYVVLGGLDYFEYAARTWQSTYQAAAKPFLTWQPNDKRVYADQPEYLYFMVDSFSVPAFCVQVRVKCTNGTTEEFTTLPYGGVKRYEVFCVPVGYAALELTRYESPKRRVLGWSVQVVDELGVPQSEERRYQVEYRYAPQKRYFLYSNSLGGTNTLACIGDAVGTFTPVQEEAERGPNPRYDPLLGDTVVLDRSGTMVLNLQTGSLSQAEQLHLQEFVLSRRVTMVRDGFYWPGKVKPKALEAFSDGDTTRVFVFDFELPRQRVFSPRLPALPALQTKPVTAGEGGRL
jgi:hypothetical protein